jgi:hypothetical protein
MLDLRMMMTALCFCLYCYCCHPLRNYCLHHQRWSSVGSSVEKTVVSGGTTPGVEWTNYSPGMMWLPYLMRPETPFISSHTTTKFFSHKWKEVRNKSFSISNILDDVKFYILDHFHYLALQTLTTQQPYMSKSACAPYENIWIVWQSILPYLIVKFTL